jgi:hypothetical protein
MDDFEGNFSFSADETISNQAKFTLLRFKEMQLEFAKPSRGGDRGMKRTENWTEVTHPSPSSIQFGFFRSTLFVCVKR